MNQPDTPTEPCGPVGWARHYAALRDQLAGTEETRPAKQEGDREAAYDAVYAYIRRLGDQMPPDPVHRNAMIWRAVHAALDAHDATPDHPKE